MTQSSNQLDSMRTLTLATGLASDMREVKAGIRQMKGDIRNLNASVDEILRLLRSRDGGSSSSN